MSNIQTDISLRKLEGKGLYVKLKFKGTTIIKIFLTCVVIITASIVSGCASVNTTLQATSAQHTPCSSKEIAVVKDPSGFSSVWTWKATCNGAAYDCTGIVDGRGGIKNSSCKQSK